MKGPPDNPCHQKCDNLRRGASGARPGQGRSSGGMASARKLEQLIRAVGEAMKMGYAIEKARGQTPADDRLGLLHNTFVEHRRIQRKAGTHDFFGDAGPDDLVQAVRGESSFPSESP